MSAISWKSNVSSKVSFCFILMDVYSQPSDSSDHMVLPGKADIYQLFDSVQIFKCFKWNPFETKFSMKNETILDLFSFYGTLSQILGNYNILKLLQTSACKYT